MSGTLRGEIWGLSFAVAHSAYQKNVDVFQNEMNSYTMSYSKNQPPDFPPKGSRHFISNFLLSAGIFAQYKTFHVSFK